MNAHDDLATGLARLHRNRACYRCGARPEHCECPDEYETERGEADQLEAADAAELASEAALEAMPAERAAAIHAAEPSPSWSDLDDDAEF